MAQLLTGIVPVVSQFLPPLINRLAPVLAQVLTALVPLAPSIAQLIAAALPPVALFQGQLPTALSQVVQILPVLVSSIQSSLSVIIGFVQIVGALFTGNFSAIPVIVSSVLNQVRGFIMARVSSGISLGDQPRGEPDRDVLLQLGGAPVQAVYVPHEDGVELAGLDVRQ